MSQHLISRVTILGTGLIGGSFALALRKYTTEMHISGWDRPDIIREAQKCGAVDEAFSGDLAPVLDNSDLIYIALPIAATIDLLPEIATDLPKSIQDLRTLEHIADCSQLPAGIAFPPQPICPAAHKRRRDCSLPRRIEDPVKSRF